MPNGSQTAKNGFRNEDDIVLKFNDWRNDEDAMHWLRIMNYDLSKIESVRAIKISGKKTDVQVQVVITIKFKGAIGYENIQIKLVSGKNGFNQIDKRWLRDYAKLWRIPDDVLELLKLYCGESHPNIPGTRDSRRMFFDEMDPNDRIKIISFFENNRFLIGSDIIRGRGAFSPEWILIVHKYDGIRWLLIPVNEAINFYGNQPVTINENGNLKIGKIGVQRKGGDGGHETANMLQFKLDPIQLMEVFPERIVSTNWQR